MEGGHVNVSTTADLVSISIVDHCRMRSDEVLDQKLLQEGCSVHTLVLTDQRGSSGGEPADLMYRIHSRLPHKR